MMHQLRQALQGMAYDMDALPGRVRYGTIASVDPARHLACVLLQPEGVLTGWMELGTPVPGWQMLPAIGSQAVIVPREGDPQNGIIVSYAYSNPSPPPSVPNAPGSGGVRATGGVTLSGAEAVLVGPGGAFVRFCADGSLLLSSQTVKIDGNLTVNGSILAEGDIADLNKAHGTMASFRTAYDTHHHPVRNVQGGTSTVTSDVPDNQV